MSADILRKAAALMRERAEAATSGPWEFRPRRGFESMGHNPATIGFNDTAGYFVMLREGTWATEGDMTYIASWHPAVALAVADLLAAVAEAWPASDPDYELSIRAEAVGHRQALAVARAYLQEPGDV